MMKSHVYRFNCPGCLTGYMGKTEGNLLPKTEEYYNVKPTFKSLRYSYGSWYCDELSIPHSIIFNTWSILSNLLH